MTRRDHCRQVSPDHLRVCGVSERIIKELEQTRLFTEEHGQFLQSSTEAIQTVMKIPDEEVKGKVISSIEKSLESGKDPVTGKITKKKAVTQTQVKQVIAKITNNCPYFFNGICEKRIGPLKIPKPCEHLEQDRLSAAEVADELELLYQKIIRDISDSTWREKRKKEMECVLS